MGSGVKVQSRVVCHDTMKVTRNMCITDRTQYVCYGIGRAVIDLVVFEELDRICNQTTFGHAKQIIQGL
jgi:hypothetical protein